MTVIQFRKRPSLAQVEAANASSAFAPPPPGVRAVGIDLGTTNSVVSVYTPGESEPETLLYNDLPLVPSLFYFDDRAGREVVGAEAANVLSEQPAIIVRGTKRSMGSVAQSFFSNEQAYSPEDAATHILKHLASHPVLEQEKSVHGGIWAVITVPAHFDDAARQATVQAAARAGIYVLRIVNEPTAAALAYSMLPDVRHSENEIVGVFDFGGGTFDVSIVERQGLVFNVLASEGDIYLGGDDIDIALANSLLKKVEPITTSRRTRPEHPLFKKLVTIAENAKISLEGKGNHNINESNLDAMGASLNTTVTRDELDAVATPYVSRTLELTERAMHAARRRAHQVSRILLVGGSTRLSLVRKMLEDYFPHSNVDARLEPDLAVSWGAAVQAAIILGIEPDTILVDVCSHSLGIGVADDTTTINNNFKKIARKFGVLHPTSEEAIQQVLGDRIHDFNRELQNTLHVAPIIHRNSPLPARRSEFFSTLYSNQMAVHLVVVQGEGQTVGENRLIGSFLFELQQPCPKGSRCEVQLTYDVNGMVHVWAKQLETTNEAEAKFDSRTGEVIGWRKLGENSLQDELEGVINPAHFSGVDDTENGVPVEPAVLNTIIARARRFLAQSLADAPHRDVVASLLESYEKLLAEAKLGATNDVEIDFVETRLLEALEKATHHDS
jgi:molecular chaperone DnaK